MCLDAINILKKLHMTQLVNLIMANGLNRQTLLDICNVCL